MPAATVQLIPYARDPLGLLAETLLADHQDALPDLNSVTVLLAEMHAAPRLRRLLLQQSHQRGYPALLGPHILSLHDWALRYLPADIRICDDHLQQLILVEALEQHPALIRSANPWALADDLLQLFDELTLNHIGLPHSLDDFIHQLQQAYGLQDTEISALGQEARLIYTLWHAWHEQLHANGLTDRQAAYLLALQNSLQAADSEQPLYLAGFHRFHRAERHWLQQLLDDNRLVLLLHGQGGDNLPEYHPEAPLQDILQQLRCAPPTPAIADAFTMTLNSVYPDGRKTLQRRSRELAAHFPESPLENRLQVLMAHSAEDEARAVELQVRRWLLAGHQRIGIVTENRRLARRVRALLERAAIQLQDAAGWTLSTTSASACLERWLECLEEDFAHLPLLDLLKSPFLFPALAPDELQYATLRLEQDIILHENIARGLQRYRDHVLARTKRLPDWFAGRPQPLLTLLDRLEAAATPVLKLTGRRQPAATWLTALLESLSRLGLDAGFNDDPAGSRLMQLLEQMQQAARQSGMQLDWLGFRTWLGRSQEQFHFQPAASGHEVHLLGLAQSRLQKFDALIIASAEREHLPGKPNPSPFFNDAVRRELGLCATVELLAERFHHFRRLLESAPRILITARCEQDGEPIAPSPWLEALQAFHKLAWRHPLSAAELAPLLKRKGTEVLQSDTAPLPQAQTQPRPIVRRGLLDKRFSAHSYQLLLDCPYRYFAARCLRLSPPEEIRLALSKADYGVRVHECLHAFHFNRPGLPGPLKGACTAARREEAIQLLNTIAEAVFARDLADNFEHHGWLKQWQDLIPKYVDWQITHAQEWRISEAETKRTAILADDVRLGGTLDRIDRQNAHLAVIDYKTGNIPGMEEITQGEAIQLPVYTLLANTADEQQVTQSAYLLLDNKKEVGFPYILSGEELEEVSAHSAGRLLTIVRQIEEGSGLPAWGDSLSCSRCEMNLLCRRQAWDER